MGNCVESFGEVEKENVGLFVIVHGGSPVMNCLHELGLTGESCFGYKRSKYRLMCHLHTSYSSKITCSKVS